MNGFQGQRVRRSAVRRSAGRYRVPVVTAVVAVLCSLSTGAGVAPTALDTHADPPPGPLDDYYSFRTVVADGYQKGIPDKTRPITYCRTDDTGLNCNGGRLQALSYEVNAQFGVSGETISGTLGISVSETVSVTAGCTTDKARPGYVLVTYPSVTRYFFHVVADNTRPNPDALGGDTAPLYPLDQVRGVESSPQLWADTPDGGVVCAKERADQPPWNSMLRSGN